MDLIFTGRFKSLNSFEWKNVPKFAVITGLNGSGKSQLLELLFNSIVTAGTKPDLYVRMSGNHINSDEVTYLKGEWQLSSSEYTRMSTIDQKSDELFNNYRSSYSRQIDANNRHHEMLFRSIEQKTLKSRNELSKSEFLEHYPDHFIDVDHAIGNRINQLFFIYRLDELERQAKKMSDEEIVAEIGNKPWDVLRDIIKESKMPFRINDPSDLGFRDGFQLKLTHDVTNAEIPFHDLSSGEKVIFSLLLYLFNSQEKNIFPKLLLLDEPDAHLHPSMTQQFINELHNVLVDKYGARVIMTTHSPSTVMLSPLESLFEMSISEPRIRKILNKNSIVSKLTSGLVLVGPGAKYFLVEDTDDVNFYNFNNQKFIENILIESTIPLIFIAASIKNDSGGVNKVSSWVEKLYNSGLEGVISGLIDKDSGNSTSHNIFAIDRYSIENYLSDPLVIYCVLLEKECAPPIIGINLSIGEEFKLKNMSQEQLQLIADTILAMINPVLTKHINNADTNTCDVTFNTGQVLKYPLWILNSKGKTILNNLYQEVFTSKVNFGTAFTAYKKLNLFPMDLINKFIEIKG